MGRGEASTDEHAPTPALSPISVDGADVMGVHWPPLSSQVQRKRAILHTRPDNMPETCQHLPLTCCWDGGTHAIGAKGTKTELDCACVCFCFLLVFFVGGFVHKGQRGVSPIPSFSVASAACHCGINVTVTQLQQTAQNETPESFSAANGLIALTFLIRPMMDSTVLTCLV